MEYLDSFNFDSISVFEHASDNIFVYLFNNCFDELMVFKDPDGLLHWHPLLIRLHIF